MFLYVGVDFSLIGLTEYIVVAVMLLRVLPPLAIRVWNYPNKQNGHSPAGPKGAVFRECGHTPYELERIRADVQFVTTASPTKEDIRRTTLLYENSTMRSVVDRFGEEV